MKFARRAAIAAALAAVLVTFGSSSRPASADSSVQLTLVAYSTPRDAFDAVIKAFQATPDGRDVTFAQSYGASGEQSRAVAAGLPADVVVFSLEPDMTKLVTAGLVAPEWNKDKYHGMVTDSVVVFVVRKGNPKHIRAWADLVKPGVEVITPNPFTSGGARWNVMAGYGAASAKGTNKAAGEAYLKALFANVPVQDDSARKALGTFTNGKGDAMLAYENEAIFAQQKGQALDYVVPSSTILIENPVAATSTSKHPTQAKAFVDFLYSAQAQKEFAANGYRPVVAGTVPASAFPTPTGLFTIKDLGGWTLVTKQFFDPQSSV